MIRFSWLQSRTQTLIVATALAALAILAAVTGVHLAHLHSSLLPACRGRTDCRLSFFRDPGIDNFLQGAFTLLMRIVPALLGIFWGAPLLAREIETGTFRLAWTQSVTRSRWVLTKLAMIGLTTVVVAGLLSLTVTWWFRGIDQLGSNQYANFDDRGLAPIAYALFAFALGTFCGVVIRRTLPAMAATLVGFVAVRIVVAEWVRPHLLTPRHLTTSLLSSGNFGFQITNGGRPDLFVGAPRMANAWVQSSRIVNNNGTASTAGERAAFIHRYCPAIGQPASVGPNKHAALRPPGQAVFASCQRHAAQMFHLVVAYQPASRYWTFQWLESGLFVALALIVAGACYWWVTRRTG